MRSLNALFFATAMALPFATQINAETTSTISVTGEGRVDVRPDMATINLGVTNSADTASAAMAANAESMGKVMENLLAAGITPADIQTSGLSLNPDWSGYSSGSDNEVASITGYTASNIVTVRVNALDGVGGILDKVIVDGANTLNGIAFGLQNPDPQQDEARKRAVVDAIHRAGILSQAAGVTLGPIVSITEGGTYSEPVPMYRMDQASAAVPVSGGDVSVAATVTMVWEIAK